MITLKRTDYQSEGFQALVKELDADLWNRYLDVQKQYIAMNKIDAIKNVVIAYSDNQAVGCACFKPFDESTIEIKRMYVRNDYRGKGIALSILKELELWARESGFSYAVLETGRKQPEAIGLYGKHQYELTENYGNYVGMEHSVCMKKPL